MAVRCSLLVAFGVALGYTPAPAPRVEEASAPPRAAAPEPIEVSPPHATPSPVPRDAEPSAPREVTPPKPMAKAEPAAPRELPGYEVTRRTTSPDGATWCILDLKLQAASVTPEKLRAVWEDLRRQETVDWKRFTCRASGPHGSVDVNEFAILGSTPAESLERGTEPSPWVSVVRRDSPEGSGTPGDGEIVIVEEGEDYVIFETDGVEIKVEKR